MADVKTETYAPGQHPDLPPPPGSTGWVGWLRANLFSSWTNSIFTLLGIWLTYGLVNSLIGWMLLDAVWHAGSRIDCQNAGTGACWAIIRVRIDQFTYGFYPTELQWRPNLAFVLMFVALAPILFDKTPMRRQMFWFSLAYPFIAAWLIRGGFGLEVVDTQSFGGFMLTLIVGVTGIVASLPIGILLALGRQSRLLSIRIICISFIELLRGVPLITLLFVASTMLNFFLPPGTTFNLLVRVLIMVTLFASVYIAEVIRGGLQAIPRGQYEAADALGLSYWRTTYLITLPQALKISIPGIVNTFIALYKDTTLVVIIGLLDPLGISKAVLADANWVGLSTETYLFVALFFFISCFAMSRYSIWLEKQLKTEH
ncbi:MAG: amino acid ABC transporter permease [Proteobacteria bacterium]|nr:amino acid ABC transporter permease [Pseudomonadota bacterium]